MARWTNPKRSMTKIARGRQRGELMRSGGIGLDRETEARIEAVAAGEMIPRDEITSLTGRDHEIGIQVNGKNQDLAQEIETGSGMIALNATHVNGQVTTGTIQDTTDPPTYKH